MKNIFTKILLTSCLSISIVNGMESERIPVSQFMSENQHKKVLSCFDIVDYDLVEKYRQDYSRVEEDNDFVLPTLVESMDSLIPIAQKGLDYVQSLLEEFPQISVLKDEIISRRETRNITPLWYHTLGARIQAAISKVSEDEIDVFNHVPGEGIAIIKALMHKDAWKNYEKSIYLINNYRKPEFNRAHIIIPETLVNKDVRQILGSLEKKLPATVFWNVYGQGKLGIPFLVHSSINDIFPLGMPNMGGMAHGVGFSPLSFTVHDYVHHDLDPRRKSLEQFVADELAEQVKKGRSLDLIAPLVIEEASKRYQLLNTGLDHLFNYYLKNLNLDHNKSAFKKGMAGFFWVLHERTGIVSNLYKTGDFIQVLKLLAGNDFIETEAEQSQNITVNYQSWTTPHDFYTTSALTGESFLTDEEIATKTKELLLAPSSELYAYQPENVSSYSVKMTKRFIDVNVTYNHHNLSFSAPTLYHKWLNLDDNKALLKYAGIVIEKPKIEGEKERDARSIALKTLKDTEKAIKQLTTDFVNYSEQLATNTWLKNNSTSLIDYYKASFEELKNDYDIKLIIATTRGSENQK